MTDQHRTPGEVLAALDARHAQAEDALRALGETPSARRDARALTYRCPRRCTLAEAYRTPDGTLLWFPRYSVSPGHRERVRTALAEAGLEGAPADRLNVAGHAAFLDTSAQFAVQCRHLTTRELPAVQVEDDLRAGRRNVVLSGPSGGPAA